VCRSVSRDAELLDRFVTVRFESLSQQPRLCLETLFRSLGLPFEEQLLSVEREDDRQSGIQPDGIWHDETSLGQGFNPERCYAWKTRMALGERLLCELLMGENFRFLEYEITPWIARWSRRLRRASWKAAAPRRDIDSG